MTPEMITLLSAGVKLAVDLLELAKQVEESGIEVPALAEVKDRLDGLKKCAPLPEE